MSPTLPLPQISGNFFNPLIKLRNIRKKQEKKNGLLLVMFSLLTANSNFRVLAKYMAKAYLFTLFTVGLRIIVLYRSLY